MTTEIALRKRELRSAQQDRALNFIKDIAIANPLLIGFSAMAVNHLLYKAGFYDGMPTRSELGGPVWFTIGKADDPPTAYYARIEAFIMAVTGAMAISGAVKGVSSITAIKDVVG